MPRDVSSTAVVRMIGACDNDAAEDRRERHVGSVAAGAESHEAHRDRGAGWIEDVPAVTEESLDVGVKVGRAERWIGAIVGTRS